MIKWRGNILDIPVRDVKYVASPLYHSPSQFPVDDAVVMQMLQAGQHRTGHKNKCISLSLLSPGEERSNAPKHCYGISFRKVAARPALAGTLNLKEFTANSELKSEVVFCSR